MIFCFTNFGERSIKNPCIKHFFFIFLQLFSEKISGAEGTKLDEVFMDMEKVRLFARVNG